MSPLLLRLLRAALRPIAAACEPVAVPEQPSPSIAAAWDRIAAAARAAERQRLYSECVRRRVSLLARADVDALFEQLEDERARGAF